MTTETTTTTIPAGWPTAEMLKPLDRFMRPEAARELLMEVFAAAPSPAPAAPSAAQTDDALTVLQKLVGEIDSLMDDSEGVAGLHKNGDIAPWDDLMSDGRYPWLGTLDEARAVCVRPVALQPSQGGGVSEADDEGPTYRIRITPDMTDDQVNAAAAAEMARVDALTEAAKRIAWAFHDRLIGIGSIQTPDGLWADSAIMTKDDKAAWIAAARAATVTPADTPELVEALANWWMSDAPFDERLTRTSLVKPVCWDLSDEGKAALDRYFAALRTAGEEANG